jgi:phospholipid transport system substrate-binding protein
MDTKANLILHLFVAGIWILCSAWPISAGEPTEQIRAAINQGVQILSSARLDDRKQKTETIGRLREVVYPLFDFEEMAKRSLGSYWRQLNPQQQKEFVTLFTELLEKTYADRIDLYDGQKVVYSGETVDKDYAEVNTKIISKKGDTYSANYKLRRVDGKWRIYDVVAENISLVNNYRSQFHRVIVNSSFEELMKRLKEKAT